MAELCVKERPIELFGIMRRLPEITTSAGNLAVSEILELVHNESIISLFEFMQERLEISHDKFIEGCIALFAKQSGSYTIVGFIRINGVLCAASKSTREEHFSVEDPNDPHVGWSPGTLVLSNAFQPAPVLSNHFKSYALV